MSETEAWYVVKRETGDCAIVSADQMTPASESAISSSPEQWGPYESREDAIARRVGLIRAGKCKPV